MSLRKMLYIRLNREKNRIVKDFKKNIIEQNEVNFQLLLNLFFSLRPSYRN